jgi:hypothetical protein
VNGLPSPFPQPSNDSREISKERKRREKEQRTGLTRKTRMIRNENRVRERKRTQGTNDEDGGKAGDED